MIEMRTGKKGAVPMPLNPRRAEGIGMKWIVQAARDGTSGKMDERLAKVKPAFLPLAHSRRAPCLRWRMFRFS